MEKIIDRQFFPILGLCTLLILGATVVAAVEDEPLTGAGYRVESGGISSMGNRSGSVQFDLLGRGGQAFGADVSSEGGGYVCEIPNDVPPLVSRILRYTLITGWNMKGSPVDSNETVGDTFTGDHGYPVKAGDLYAWQSGSRRDSGAYVTRSTEDTLLANEGFWVFSLWGGTGQEFSGSRGSRPPLADQLEDGWNLYSPTDTMVLPEGFPAVFRWDAQQQVYRSVPPGELLFPLQAYWIFY